MLFRRFFPLLCVQVVAAVAVLDGCIIVGTNTSDGAGPASGVTSGTGTGAGGSTGASTGAGGTMCTGAAGLGSVADCDKLSIAPNMAEIPAVCPATMMSPPGYRVCTSGFTIFTGGSADELDACLADIAPADACDITPVQGCIDRIFMDACADPAIDATCADLGKQCGAQAFDVSRCSTDLRPFSNAGLQQLQDCINTADPSLTCQQAYDSCFQQVLTF